MENLPKKWCLAVTEENKKIIGQWRTAGYCGQIEHGQGWVTNYGEENGTLGYWVYAKASDDIEITFEDFKHLVLKERIILEYQIY